MNLFRTLTLDIQTRGRSAVIRCASDGHRLCAVDLPLSASAELRALADEIDRAQGRTPPLPLSGGAA